MKIQVKSMEDTQRLILMSQGEVFIWHIQKHLDNIAGLNMISKSKKIPDGKVGCKICGKTVQEIFNTEKEDYYKSMKEKYND